LTASICNVLRGLIDVGDYKQYIFPLYIRWGTGDPVTSWILTAWPRS